VVEIGDAYFIEIARLRALRILWSNSLAALGHEKPSLFVEGRFANRDMSEDVHQNMIAAGSKALSAITGGVDRLIIAPSDTKPSAFHRRISRNIHHVLRYESKIDTIDDPVQGSYYLENLTRQLVEKAWSQLLKIEW
jgi:methylmalonyl-CoA mutase